MVTLSARLALSIQVRFRCVACWSLGFRDVGSTATDVGVLVNRGLNVTLGSVLAGRCCGDLGSSSRRVNKLTGGVSVLLRGPTGGASVFRRVAISVDRAGARLVVNITVDRAGARLDAADRVGARPGAITRDRAGARLRGARLADGAGALER
jgi:hypothetical protein